VIGILFLLGITGVILPILNGTFFLMIALVLLSFESPYVKKKLHVLTNKNTTAHKWHLYIEEKLKRLLKIK
jgi:uncharacterized membrane protein YbaN (DUF454 family)